MLFNSLDFAIFLPIIFFLYWFVVNKNLKYQNILIALSSYVFYGWWDWRFLALILFSTLVDYVVGLSLGKEKNLNKRKILLWSSILVNLGFLGFFKYYNFFLDNFKSAFTFFGTEINADSLNIILPVGISFYTFQTLSYTIDIYKNKIKPTTDFVAFAAFVCFFPQLVAGPIERAKNFLPQFKKERIFNYSSAVDGLRQILWGLFKKLVIADNCAVYVNYIFENSNDLSGSTLLLGGFLFCFQIYADFSGYSDIAIGSARLFGFNLMQNFAYPLFSRDIPEFWRRWHISLTTWFRDYLYMPLNRKIRGGLSRIINIVILFTITGFWHGANWTFLAWGFINALYFLPYLLIKKLKSNTGIVAEHSSFPNLKEISQVTFTFLLSVFAIIFFRARNLEHAFSYINGIVNESLFSVPYYRGLGWSKPLFILLLLFFTVEWIGRRHLFAIEGMKNIKSKFLRRGIYCLIILLIGVYMWADTSDYIYFQF